MKRHLLTVLTGSIFAFTFVALLFLACPDKAEASLIGDKITWQYYFNGAELDYFYGPYGYSREDASFVVDGSALSYARQIFTISANESQIIIDYIAALDSGKNSWWVSGVDSLDDGTLYINNGILLTDNDNVFTSVGIAFNNMVGFSSSNITRNSNNIAINWDGLYFDADTRIVLNVGTPNTDGPPTSVPEPATMLLFGSGLVGLLAGRRMLKR